ncbi:MAG: PAS domain S-box protein [Acidimicrobiia bacterium]|nr:PAS domain S-box protein [Acidimicrobiia bacterium]
MNLSSELAAGHMQAAPDGMLIFDSSGCVKWSNSAAEELFGFPEGGLIGRSMQDLVPKRFRSAHAMSHRSYIQDPQPRFMGAGPENLVGLRRDGTEFAAEISLGPLRPSEEEISVLAIVRDVTSLRTQQSESQAIHASLDAVEEAIYMFEVGSFRLCYVNDGACRQSGLSRAELLSGVTFTDLAHGLGRQEFEDILAPLLAGDRSLITFDSVHSRTGSADRNVEVLIQHPGTTTFGKDCMIALVRDTTERLEQIRRLSTSERAFRSAFEDAPVGMAIADLSDTGARRILAANQSLADMLGRSIDELIGETFDALTHPEDRQSSTAGAEGLATGRFDLYRTQKRYLRSDGSVVTALLSAASLAADEGPRTLAHIVDMSRILEAESERDQREELLTFLGDIRLAVLADKPLDKVLAFITQTAIESLGAVHSLIAMPDSFGELRVSATAGDINSVDVGHKIAEGSLEAVAFASGEKMVVENLSRRSKPGPTAKERYRQIGPAIFAPLLSHAKPVGVLLVGRPPGFAPFSDDEIRFVEALSSESALALQFQIARDQRVRLELVEERERIATELQDSVIQRLFAAGMRLQAAGGDHQRLSAAADEVVAEIDSSIAVIRDTIFNLESRARN